ncbi:MAG: hypothetical protein FJZ94_05430 [Chloroflexi bacterium]|nr:hypothetical protein [Chloroflexota bacterium]
MERGCKRHQFVAGRLLLVARDGINVARGFSPAEATLKGRAWNLQLPIAGYQMPPGNWGRLLHPDKSGFAMTKGGGAT